MKLIAIDLDGTLLSEHTYITEENVQAIRTAQSQGHIVMICSGRAPEDIQEILKKYQLSCPLAGSNGTVVQAEGKLLGSVSMNRDNIMQIAKKLDDVRAPYRIYTNQGIFVPEDWSERVNTDLQGDTIKVDGLSEELFKRITEQPQQSDLIKYFRDYHELFGREDLKVQKFFILTLNHQKKSELTTYLSNISGAAATSSGPMNIEVMDQDGNKGNALKVMADYYGISMDDTVAMGDSFNDIPMLQAAGLSIAMGNADPAVKQLCKAVTLSNTENGVSYALEQFILNQ
ncbi:Cof-type HAD-IIB family hydrolase [Neobacillus sp. 179-C4.2 HS]|uniref:Cof-type HAD-IIB family hydrolase n=1 Tax=Neobacillus driksii TaxID=3035913 RepID=A0ABV4YZ75_9BACI|nr:Cof-type HAD-IIB family hydrolase [Neobacillus sp. 179.-C4.2 HS]MDP5194749.1 Cof-type HAD-IIB family hydrolase [Neobacillus sp. 179.-C4.2 HS]